MCQYLCPRMSLFLGGSFMPSYISFLNFSVLVTEEQKKNILNYYFIVISNLTKKGTYNKTQRNLKKHLWWDHQNFTQLTVPEIHPRQNEGPHASKWLSTLHSWLRLPTK